METFSRTGAYDQVLIRDGWTLRKHSRQNSSSEVKQVSGCCGCTRRPCYFTILSRDAGTALVHGGAKKAEIYRTNKYIIERSKYAASYRDPSVSRSSPELFLLQLEICFNYAVTDIKDGAIRILYSKNGLYSTS